MKRNWKDFPGGTVAKMLNVGSSVPYQGTRSHGLRLKTPHGETKTQCS